MTEKDRQLSVAAVLGVLGGIGVIAMAAKGLKEGVTTEERKDLLKLAVVGLGGYAIAEAFQLEDAWWWNIEAASKRIPSPSDLAKEYLPR